MPAMPTLNPKLVAELAKGAEPGSIERLDASGRELEAVGRRFCAFYLWGGAKGQLWQGGPVWRAARSQCPGQPPDAPTP